MYSSFFSQNIKKLKIYENGQAIGICPLHNDHTPSFSCNVKEGVWKCHGCGKQGNISQLASILGVQFPNKKAWGNLEQVSTYTYEDEDRNPVIQVRKYLPKTYRQFRYDRDRGWIPGLNGTKKILYRLPDIIPHDTVYISEGEKDVDSLWSWDIPATTNIGGALKWHDEYSEILRDKSIVIIPDNDEVGRKHANQIADSLFGKVKSLKIVNLPDVKDVTEWIELGRTQVELNEIVSNTKPFEGSSKRCRGLLLTSLSDLLAEPDEEREWIVDGLLSSGGLSILAAKPKTGKSTLARQLALCVSRGEPFLDRETVGGQVIYLALEERRADVRSHFKLMGATGSENLKVYTEIPPPDGVVQLRETAVDNKPVLIVIDTLARLAKIKDGNDYIQTTAGLEPFIALAREVGTHILLLHHTKKGNSKGLDSVLGSTGLTGSVDTIVILNRSEKYRTINSVQRTGEDIEESVLDFNKDTRWTTLGGSREDAEIQRTENIIREFLSNQRIAVDERTIGEGVEAKKVYRIKALRQLVSRGEVQREGAGKRGSPYLYKIAGSLVPSICGEPENQKQNIDLNTCNHRDNTGSQVDLDFDQDAIDMSSEIADRDNGLDQINERK